MLQTHENVTIATILNISRNTATIESNNKYKVPTIKEEVIAITVVIEK